MNVTRVSLPDYVVYTARTTTSRPRLAFDRAHMPAAMGYFDAQWELPAGEGTPASATGAPARPAPGGTRDSRLQAR